MQTKEGPIDFQAREPVSPLFAGLRETNQAMELQVTQEYWDSSGTWFTLRRCGSRCWISICARITGRLR